MRITRIHKDPMTMKSIPPLKGVTKLTTIGQNTGSFPIPIRRSSIGAKRKAKIMPMQIQFNTLNKIRFFIIIFFVINIVQFFSSIAKTLNIKLRRYEQEKRNI